MAWTQEQIESTLNGILQKSNELAKRLETAEAHLEADRKSGNAAFAALDKKTDGLDQMCKYINANVADAVKLGSTVADIAGKQKDAQALFVAVQARLAEHDGKIDVIAREVASQAGKITALEKIEKPISDLETWLGLTGGFFSGLAGSVWGLVKGLSSKAWAVGKVVAPYAICAVVGAVLLGHLAIPGCVNPFHPDVPVVTFKPPFAVFEGAKKLPGSYPDQASALAAAKAAAVADSAAVDVRDSAGVLVQSVPAPPPNPAPIPLPGFRVLVVYDKDTLTDAQQGIVFGRAVRDYLDAHCVKGEDGKTPDRRIYPYGVDASGEAQWIRDVMQRHPGEKSYFVVSNGKDGYSGPLPENADKALEILKRYGG
jgi:hypothetical protein